MADPAFGRSWGLWGFGWRFSFSSEAWRQLSVCLAEPTCELWLRYVSGCLAGRKWVCAYVSHHGSRPGCVRTLAIKVAAHMSGLIVLYVVAWRLDFVRVCADLAITEAARL